MSDAEPTPTPPSEDAASAHVTAEMNRSVDVIEQQLAQLQRTQQISRIIILIIGVLILVEVTVFGWYVYKSATQTFEPDALRRESVGAFQELEPALLASMQRVLQESGPVYMEELTERFKTVGPEVGQDFVNEFDKIPDWMVAEMQRQFVAKQERVYKEMEPRLLELMPALHTEEGKTRVSSRLRDETDRIEQRIAEMFQADLDQLTRALDKMEADRPRIPEGVSPEQQFVHLLLMWADHEVMQGHKGDAYQTEPEADAGLLVRTEANVDDVNGESDIAPPNTEPVTAPQPVTAPTPKPAPTIAPKPQPAAVPAPSKPVTPKTPKTPEAAPKPQPAPKPIAKPAQQPKVEPDPEAESKPAAKPKADDDSPKPQPAPKPATKPAPKETPDAKNQPESKPKPEPKAPGNAEEKPDAKATEPTDSNEAPTAGSEAEPDADTPEKESDADAKPEGGEEKGGN